MVLQAPRNRTKRRKGHTTTPHATCPLLHCKLPSGLRRSVAARFPSVLSERSGRRAAPALQRVVATARAAACTPTSVRMQCVRGAHAMSCAFSFAEGDGATTPHRHHPLHRSITSEHRHRPIHRAAASSMPCPVARASPCCAAPSIGGAYHGGWGGGAMNTAGRQGRRGEAASDLARKRLPF